MSNDAGIKYDLDGGVYGTGNNGTYYIKADGGGLNELHITADPASQYGQVTTSHDQSGVFYLSNTGGRGFDDDIVLLLAVNGTVPDDFAVHIKTSGYTWTPSPVKNQAPTNYTYVDGAVDETFTKEDFIYGPQTWKPGPGIIGTVGLPLYESQDVSDTNNTFSLMFIDLNAGNLKSTNFVGLADDGQGAVKVEYSFENLETFAAFNGYGWCLAANQDQGISWTNLPTGSGASGYSVVGIPPVLTSISVSPETAEIAQWDGMQFNATALEQRGRVMKNVTFAWSSSDETVGTVTEDGYFMALSPGTTTISATNGTVSGTASVRVTVPSVAMEPMSQNRHIFIKVANDDGVKYNLDGGVYGVWNNNTYYMKADGGGLNELHITADPASQSGQVTTSGNQSGVVYFSNTGGRGFTDDIIFLIAVNGTVPDDIAVHIKTSGYTWTPSNVIPTNYTYVDGAVDETFTKEDFIYGPQTWKPGPGNLGPVGLPFCEGQDVSDTNNTFSLMFFDLKVGNMKPSSFFGATLIDGGDAKVEYSFENLETFATFAGYGWCLAANQGQGISWTNRPTGIGASSYSVVGIPPVFTSVSVSPARTSVLEGASMQFTATALEQRGRPMKNISFVWSSSDETVGTVDANGCFKALSPGTTTITAANGTINGTATVSVLPAPDGKSDGSGSSTAASGNLNAGASTTLSYGSGPVSTVTVTVSKRTEGLMLAVMPVDNLPIDGPSGPVYRSLQVNLSYADDSAIDNAVFTFSVPLSWLQEQGLTTQDIVLMRYHDGAWSPLPTELIDVTGSEAHYRATSPGFSYFAITGTKGGTSVQASAQSASGTVTPETPAPTASTTPAVTATETAETTTPATTPTTQQSPLPWFVAVVALGALFLIGKRE